MSIPVIMLILFIGVYVGLVLPYYVNKLVINREKKRELNALMPTKVDDSRLCKEPHIWMEAISLNENIEYVPINVCSTCGFIPSRNMMTTKEGLKRIIENNYIRKLEEDIHRDFENKENEEIKKFLKSEIENGLTYDKINEIYHAGQTSGKRFIIYKIARGEELRREQGSA